MSKFDGSGPVGVDYTMEDIDGTVLQIRIAAPAKDEREHPRRYRMRSILRPACTALIILLCGLTSFITFYMIEDFHSRCILVFGELVLLYPLLTAPVDETVEVEH